MLCHQYFTGFKRLFKETDSTIETSPAFDPNLDVQEVVTDDNPISVEVVIDDNPISVGEEAAASSSVPHYSKN